MRGARKWAYRSFWKPKRPAALRAFDLRDFDVTSLCHHALTALTERPVVDLLRRDATMAENLVGQFVEIWKLCSSESLYAARNEADDTGCLSKHSKWHENRVTDSGQYNGPHAPCPRFTLLPHIPPHRMTQEDLEATSCEDSDGIYHDGCISALATAMGAILSNVVREFQPRGA